MPKENKELMPLPKMPEEGSCERPTPGCARKEDPMIPRPYRYYKPVRRKPGFECGLEAPKPMGTNELGKIPGGLADGLKSVKLEDGGYAVVPEKAIFDTAKDAEQASDMMMMRPPMPGPMHPPGTNCGKCPHRPEDIRHDRPLMTNPFGRPVENRKHDNQNSK